MSHRQTNLMRQNKMSHRQTNLMRQDRNKNGRNETWKHMEDFYLNF